MVVISGSGVGDNAREITVVDVLSDDELDVCDVGDNVVVVEKDRLDDDNLALVNGGVTGGCISEESTSVSFL